MKKKLCALLLCSAVFVTDASARLCLQEEALNFGIQVAPNIAKSVFVTVQSHIESAIRLNLLQEKDLVVEVSGQKVPVIHGNQNVPMALLRLAGVDFSKIPVMGAPVASAVGMGGNLMLDKILRAWVNPSLQKNMPEGMNVENLLNSNNYIGAISTVFAAGIVGGIGSLDFSNQCTFEKLAKVQDASFSSNDHFYAEVKHQLIQTILSWTQEALSPAVENLSSTVVYAVFNCAKNVSTIAFGLSGNAPAATAAYVGTGLAEQCLSGSLKSIVSALISNVLEEQTQKLYSAFMSPEEVAALASAYKTSTVSIENLLDSFSDTSSSMDKSGFYDTQEDLDPEDVSWEVIENNSEATQFKNAFVTAQQTVGSPSTAFNKLKKAATNSWFGSLKNKASTVSRFLLG